MAKEKNLKKEGAEQTGDVALPADAGVQSQRDRYRSRTEWDDADEEGSYERANQRLDDLDALNEGVNNLRGVMDNNPYFAQMIAEARKNKDFNPVLYLIENGSLDLDALRDDPDYSEKIADAQNAWLKKKADADESDRVLGENLRREIDGCIEDGMAMGMTEDEALEQLGRTFEWLDRLDKGEVRELNAILLKGAKHDADVEAAAEQGEANGRAAKVKDALKRMPRMSTRSGGSQPSGTETVPERGESMFGL